MLWFQTQPSSSRASPCTARTERKSSQGKAEAGVFASTSTTHGVMKGTYTLLNPSAPLIWNSIRFCVDRSGYRGNLHHNQAVYIPPQANTDQALKELYRNISEQETAHPDADFVVTGDFNKANFMNNSSKILSTRHHQHAWRSYTRPLLLPLPGRIQVPPPPTFRQIGSLFRSAPACL